jgi:HAMP domain-containing protein
MNPLNKLKMKHKVILAFVGLTTVVIGLLAALSLESFRSSLRDEVLESHRFFARYLSSSLEGKMERASRVARSLAGSPGLASLPPAQKQLIFDQCIVWSGRMFSGIWYFNSSGRCEVTVPVRQNPLGKNFLELPGMDGPVQEMRRTGRTVVVGRFAEPKKGQKAVILSPVGNSGAFVSALVDLSDWRTFSRAGAREQYAALIDDKGLLVSLDPDPKGLLGSTYRLVIDGLSQLPQSLTSDTAGVDPVPEDPSLLRTRAISPVTGEREYVTLASVPVLGLRLVVGVSERHALASIERLRTRIWMLTALCWLAAAFLGAGFASLVVRPLTALTRHVESLERGQLREELDWRFTDEIGVLGRAINAMTRTLRRERVMKDVFSPAREREEPRED